MIKQVLTIAAALGLVAPAGALSLAQNTGTTAGGLDFVSFTLLPEELTGQFDTLDLALTLTTGTYLADADVTASLLNVGDDETSFSVFLTAPALFGGKGLSEFGYTETSTLLGATYASLGNNNASNSITLLGQVVLNEGLANSVGSIRVLLLDNGQEVGEISETFGVPEPTSLALVGLGGLLMAGRRRRA